MLPPKRKKASRGFNILLKEDLILALDEIVATEDGVGSRNALIGSFLDFDVDLFERQKPLLKQIQEFKEEEAARTGRKVDDVSDAEVHTLLLGLGLKAWKKK